MPSGYLYALANESMPGVFKVGCTSRNPLERANELHTTGVPTPFQVVLALWVDDMEAAEVQLHTVLGTVGTRVSNQREFFQVSYARLIEALTHLPLSEPAGRQQVSVLSHQAVLEQAKVYHTGQGLTPPDFKKAVKLYEQAAMLGSEEAAELLADAYLYGTGKLTKKSDAKGSFYRQRAKDIAQQQLEQLYGKDLLELINQKNWQSAWTVAAKRGNVAALRHIWTFLVPSNPFALGSPIIDKPEILSTFAFLALQWKENNSEEFKRFIQEKAKEYRIMNLTLAGYLDELYKPMWQSAIRKKTPLFPAEPLHAFREAVQACAAVAEALDSPDSFQQLAGFSDEAISALGVEHPMWVHLLYRFRSNRYPKR